MNFRFDGNMSRDGNYLSRAVTAEWLYESDTPEDDLRTIARLQVKFIGRASGIRYIPVEDEEHFRKYKALADRAHAQDPEIILQACIFENAVKRMEEAEIPAYVFQAFGNPWKSAGL